MAVVPAGILVTRVGYVHLEVDRARPWIGPGRSARDLCEHLGARREHPDADGRRDGTRAKSFSGASTVTRTVFRSTSDTIGVPGRTKAPGSAVRVAISPSNGALRTQSRTSSDLELSLARLSSTSACCDAESAVLSSTSFGAMNPPASNDVSRAALSALARCRAPTACTCMATARLAALGLEQSRVASTCPRLTTSPGLTVTVSMYAEMY